MVCTDAGASWNAGFCAARAVKMRSGIITPNARISARMRMVDFPIGYSSLDVTPDLKLSDSIFSPGFRVYKPQNSGATRAPLSFPAGAFGSIPLDDRTGRFAPTIFPPALTDHGRIERLGAGVSSSGGYPAMGQFAAAGLPRHPEVKAG